jgi:hypothetical protein
MLIHCKKKFSVPRWVDSKEGKFGFFLLGVNSCVTLSRIAVQPSTGPAEDKSIGRQKHKEDAKDPPLPGKASAET